MGPPVKKIEHMKIHFQEKYQFWGPVTFWSTFSVVIPDLRVTIWSVKWHVYTITISMLSPREMGKQLVFEGSLGTDSVC